ncbi:hypothetical protein N9L01_00275 [bacterium]|nr:hypothetical protein [bacterium]
MEPFDLGWMQTISLVMYLLILAHMVRVWLSLKVYSHELEKVMDAIYDIHHHMGLCNCGDPSVLVLPLSKLEEHFGLAEDLDELSSAEAIREWDEG